MENPKLHNSLAFHLTGPEPSYEENVFKPIGVAARLLVVDKLARRFDSNADLQNGGRK
jgi:hypothetical protein